MKSKHHKRSRQQDDRTSKNNVLQPFKIMFPFIIILEEQKMIAITYILKLAFFPLLLMLHPAQREHYQKRKPQYCNSGTDLVGKGLLAVNKTY